MAKFIVNSNSVLFVVVVQYLVFCYQTHAVDYDSSFTAECLEEALPPQYDGGIIANSELNEGLTGRPKQSFILEADVHYVLSAWLQISHGKASVAAVLKTEAEDITVGRVTAQNGCWSMLKGGLTSKASGPAELYFTSNNTEVEIWADSFSAQTFTREEWKTHQLRSIDKVRKSKVRVKVVDKAGRPVPNATVSLTQKRTDFQFGCAINSNILQNQAYQNWYLPRFKNRVTVFENELKWYSTERIRGVEDYSTADALFAFAEANGISVRGHNVFWDKRDSQPGWVPNLSKEDLSAAVNKRINSVMKRYAGKVIHWDVVNENLHGNFFEDKLNDPAASSKFYQTAQGLDPKATLFMNEYNTIEWPQDPSSSPQKYLDKIAQMKSQGYNGNIGIGLESHFTNPDVVSTRIALEQLVSSGHGPIWITELDVASGADGLSSVLTELASQEAVKGIVLWNAWSPHGCYVACLTDNNFQNLPAGDVVDKFLAGLSHAQDPKVRGMSTDSNGFVEVSLHHGDYKLKVTRPTSRSGRSTTKRINVRPNDKEWRAQRLTIHHMH